MIEVIVQFNHLTDPDIEKIRNINGLTELIRCKACKHRFDGEQFENCCEKLMDKIKWIAEIPVEDDWFCADGEREEE